MGDMTLTVVIRTPQETLLDEEANSLRVPADTGHVGFRPRAEATVMSVESGIIQIRRTERTLFAGTPGGLLRWDGKTAVILTPLAVIGENAGEIAALLGETLGQPNEEIEARKVLERLEGRIVKELQQGVADRTADRERRGP